MSLFEKLKNYLYDEKTDEFDGSAESLQKKIEELSESRPFEKKEEYATLTDEQKEDLKRKTIAQEKERLEYYSNIKISESYTQSEKTSYDDPIFKATLENTTLQKRAKQDVSTSVEEKEKTHGEKQIQSNNNDQHTVEENKNDDADSHDSEDEDQLQTSTVEEYERLVSQIDELSKNASTTSDVEESEEEDSEEPEEKLSDEVSACSCCSSNFATELNQKPAAMRKNSRPTWDEYFVNIANEVASRATCDRGRSGCIIVKDNQILVAGYVGSPIGLPHCDDVGHLLRKTVREDGTTSEHCVRTVHAEQNAICQAARRGIPIEGATLYCRMTPCRVCAMLIINCGIKRVVCERKYQRAQDAEEMFELSNIELVYINDEVQNYEEASKQN